MCLCVCVLNSVREKAAAEEVAAIESAAEPSWDLHRDATRCSARHRTVKIEEGAGEP